MTAPRVLSAGVVVVHRDPVHPDLAQPGLAGWRFLLLSAFKNWDFPKGMVDPGETPLEAARREVTEETLIEDLRFDWGFDYRETMPYAHNKVARYYLAATPNTAVTLPISPELGHPEHNEFRWVSFEDALKLCPARLEPILRWAVDTLGHR